jgi:hypothetical protein
VAISIIKGWIYCLFISSDQNWDIPTFFGGISSGTAPIWKNFEIAGQTDNNETNGLQK